MYISEPCKTSSYSLKSIEFDPKSKMAHYLIDDYFATMNVNKTADTTTSHFILRFFSTEVEVSEKIEMMNVNSFISSVGGNLGLFIGFSFLSTLFIIHDVIGKTIYKIKA